MGGARIGAGRKPQPKTVMVPSPTGRPPEAPPDLAAGERAAWRRLAWAAWKAGTLVPGTVAGFRLLCEIEVAWQEARAQLAADGWVTGGLVHPLASTVCKLAQRRESALKSYGLMAMGKPVTARVEEAQKDWRAVVYQMPKT